MTLDTLILIIGAYMAAGALAMALRPSMAHTIVGELRDSSALCFITGVFMFFAGTALLSFYTDFTSLKRAVLTLIAYGMTAEAFVLIVWPSALLDFAEKMVLGPVATRSFAVIVALMSAALIALALT